MKEKVIKILKESLASLNYPNIEPIIQNPKENIDADLASNIAFLLSKDLKQSPYDIAKNIKNDLSSSDLFENIEVAKPGFLNFKIKSEIIVNELKNIITEKEGYGKNSTGKNQTVLVEFVSANPTGPLTVGHGRGAIIGDVISNIYAFNGYKVNREYYYNNAGRQMRKLGESVQFNLRAIQQIA